MARKCLRNVMLTDLLVCMSLTLRGKSDSSLAVQGLSCRLLILNMKQATGWPEQAASSAR